MSTWRDYLTRDEEADLIVIESKRKALRQDLRAMTAAFNTLLARGHMRKDRDQ